MRLTITGRLLPMLTIVTMRGLSTSTTATRTTTIRTITTMFGVLEQESKKDFSYQVLGVVS